MTTEDKKNYGTICYLTAIACGLFIGLIADKGIVSLLVWVLVGIISAWIWLRTRAKSSFDDVQQNF